MNRLFKNTFRIILSAALFITFNANAQSLIIKTNKGYIRGVSENNITVFKGIPYAAPPVGNLRFKAPQPHAAWRDTLAATEFGSIAMQASGGSEDCLTLNVYTPKADNAKRPVLVWVHGGSMTSGSGKGQNGHAFADRDDIVTVTINYRLGIFGFTYLDDLGKAYAGSGNNGVRDCIAALRWVKQNIAAFGGDPNRVTIMGESAGAKLESAVLVSPAAKGLFNQYIAESGSVQCVRDINTAKGERDRLLKQAHLTKQDAAKLLTMPADSLMKLQAAVTAGVTGLIFFGPVNDGVVIPDDPYKYAAAKKLPKIKALMGTNANEFTLFMDRYHEMKNPDAAAVRALFADNSPMVYKTYLDNAKTLSAYDAADKTFTEYMYTMHNYRWAKALVNAGIPTWEYRFDFIKNDALKAAHAREMSFIWFDPTSKSMADAEKRNLAINMHKAWVAFIKTGNPNIPELPKWPLYQTNTKPVMLFNINSEVTNLKTVFDDKTFPTTVMVFKR